ncbi:DUF3093 domain-containing protein [Aeromicrobium terrae]|uniref:DUF3093 domain-containing protein n=1 Tax=Aeromicrobium terrae TaxID=2498846 RepID=A0A5C8NQ09_9ACTN|nr:DUF3093 domain-containing protein [Aeromicrobium terrae]
MMRQSGVVSTYRERLTAPASWWVTALVFGLVCGWIVLVATTWPIGIVAAVVGTAVAAGLVWAYGSVAIIAGPDGLDVAGTRLPPEHLGTVVALDRRAFRDRLGPDADARAWLRTRPYVDGGILAEVTDPADPTPYWLVSCRRPQAVVDALGHTEDASTTNGDAHRGEEEG